METYFLDQKLRQAKETQSYVSSICKYVKKNLLEVRKGNNVIDLSIIKCSKKAKEVKVY